MVQDILLHAKEIEKCLEIGIQIKLFSGLMTKVLMILLKYVKIKKLLVKNF